MNRIMLTVSSGHRLVSHNRSNTSLITWLLSNKRTPYFFFQFVWLRNLQQTNRTWANRSIARTCTDDNQRTTTITKLSNQRRIQPNINLWHGIKWNYSTMMQNWANLLDHDEELSESIRPWWRIEGEHGTLQLTNNNHTIQQLDQ